MPEAAPVIQRTRLAPSPTGALHLGNARTFLVNWALARQHGWRILLRIEDLDSPRVKQGSDRDAIDILHWLGIDWDEGPVYQSSDLEPYRAAMRDLAARGLAYPSTLTRTQIEDAASAPQEGSHETPFPAALRPPDLAPRQFVESDANWRLLVPPGTVRFHDHCKGPCAFDVAALVGDFVLWTRRGVPAYQLAVVVDDHRQRVTHIVRGDDLLDSAARQILVARALHLEFNPAFTHLPLVRGPDGRRLAKRHGDTRLTTYRQRGVPPERVLGLLAAWSGLLPRNRPQPLSTDDFRRHFQLSRMSGDPVVMTPEDDAWLSAEARS